MKRFWWLLPTLAVLVGAFLLPDLLLSAKEKRMESRVFASADVTPTWQGTGASLSMGEKLALMSRMESAVQYDFGVITDDKEVRQHYHDELYTLKEEKLISPGVYDWLLYYEELEISKAVLLDMEQGESLSMYRVQYYDGTTHVLLDAQTYKLLGIVLNAYEPQVVDSEAGLLFDDHVYIGAPKWDVYYGAEQVGKSDTWLFRTPDGDDYYLYARSFRVDGIDLGVTLHYSGVMQTLTWRIDSAENVAWVLTGEFSDDASGEIAP